jgi:hypothetical protein
MITELGFKVKQFVGQAKKKDTGLSQKKQKEILEQFTNSEFNVLVSSSVGEEGLDIPQVDLVIFYEPVPSAIRKIQRSGRTGRLEKGRIIMLITKDTMDEVYYHVARSKEKRMYRAIDVMKKNFSLNGMMNGKGLSGNNLERSKTATLHDYSEDNIEEKTIQEKQKQNHEENNYKIVADYREKGSNVLKELVDADVNLQLEKLSIGDFLLSGKVIIEYKTVQDFVDSIIDGRLLTQLKELKKYEKPVLIIEGVEDMYSVRRIHPNAIRGMLVTITVSYGIPLIQTKTHKETAEILKMIAKKEQSEEKSGVTYHFLKAAIIKGAAGIFHLSTS